MECLTLSVNKTCALVLKLLKQTQFFFQFIVILRHVYRLYLVHTLLPKIPCPTLNANKDSKFLGDYCPIPDMIIGMTNPFIATVALMRHRKKCSPSSYAAFQRRRLSWDFHFFCGIQPMALGLQILLIHSILCFRNAILILNVKVVPNDIFFIWRRKSQII